MDAERIDRRDAGDAPHVHAASRRQPPSFPHRRESILIFASAETEVSFPAVHPFAIHGSPAVIARHATGMAQVALTATACARMTILRRESNGTGSRLAPG
jgi:hypothetical protein